MQNLQALKQQLEAELSEAQKSAEKYEAAKAELAAAGPEAEEMGKATYYAIKFAAEKCAQAVEMLTAAGI